MTADTFDNHQPLDHYPATSADQQRFARSLGAYLDFLGTQDPVVLDLAGVSSVTEFFAIATVTSQTHLKGVVRQLDEWMQSADVRSRSRRQTREDNGWILLDCDFIVIHLMTREMRDFYELEKLWFEAGRVYPRDIHALNES